MSMTLKETFKIKEKTDFCLIDIVYKPVFNKEEPILCYFTDSSHLPFRSYIRRNTILTLQIVVTYHLEAI